MHLRKNVFVEARKIANVLPKLIESELWELHLLYSLPRELRFVSPEQRSFVSESVTLTSY